MPASVCLSLQRQWRALLAQAQGCENSDRPIRSIERAVKQFQASFKRRTLCRIWNHPLTRPGLLAMVSMLRGEG